jgi:hypothetical protein
LPRLTDDEYTALKVDITENGIRVPIDVDELGVVLDGHHRAWIAADLGIDCPRRVVTGLTDDQKRTHALAVNVYRRNLTREQRREVVARLRGEGMSLPRIARAMGVSVGTAHADVQAFSSENVNPSAITGSDGKTYPASRPTPVLPPTAQWTPRADRQPQDNAPTVADWPAIPPPGNPATPKRRPLPDAFRDAALDLSKAVDRVTRLVEDDRYPKNAEQIAGMCRNDLLRTADALAKVLGQLPTPKESNP